MKRTLNFGKHEYNGIGRKINQITIEIELETKKDNKQVFTACGNVWNNLHTDLIAGGQCIDSILESVPSLKHNKLYMEVVELWKKWHLNDMHAGTPEQERFIKSWIEKGNKYDYTTICEHLQAVGLYEVEYNGSWYKYGHGWLYQEIDAIDLQRINKLFE